MHAFVTQCDGHGSDEAMNGPGPGPSVHPFRPCLVPSKILKIFKISRHIESLGTCLKY